MGEKDGELDAMRNEYSSQKEIIQGCIRCPPEPLCLFRKRPVFTDFLYKTEHGLDHITGKLMEIFDAPTPPPQQSVVAWINQILCDKMGFYLLGILIDQIDYNRIYGIFAFSRDSPFGIIVCFGITIPDTDTLAQKARLCRRTEDHRYRIMARDYYLDPTKAQASHDLKDFYSLPLQPISFAYLPLALALRAFLEPPPPPSSSSQQPIRTNK